MNRGAVMVYFGQEVGEPGIGAEGFSGEDSRTTIFDYWGVPEHQKWMNDGKFDGGQLSDDQIRLRAFYKEILSLCNESDAVKNGDFFDLHYFNRNGDFQGYSEKVYAYLRYTSSETLLFVLNFGDEAASCHIKIPQLAFDMMKMSQDSVTIEDFYNWNKKQSFASKQLQSYHDGDGLKLEVFPNSYQILKIR